MNQCPCFSVCCCFQVPLTICYHGSLLVQALAKFKEHSILLSSLHTLSPADLLTLAWDPAGSHVLQALITTCSDKGRGKILKRLEVLHNVHVILSLKKTIQNATHNCFYSPQGQFVPMACSRSGSRVLEAVWNSATVSQRQSIAQDLSKINRLPSLITKITYNSLSCVSSCSSSM